MGVIGITVKQSYLLDKENFSNTNLLFFQISERKELLT